MKIAGFIFLLFLASSIEAKIEPIERLGVYGDGLNMEGGLIPRRSLKDHQIWANVCFVLDRPLIDKTDLDEITASNPYRLKESSIPGYNECRAALVQALIMKYYLAKQNYGHIILNVHRNSSGPRHLDDLETILIKCLDEMDIHKAGPRKFQCGSTTLELQSGTKNLSGYEHADVVISISLVAGFNPEWPAGTAIIPSKFTPFDVHSMIVAESGTFETNNHLRFAIDDVLSLQSKHLIDNINREFHSPNPEKANLKTARLTKKDFKEGRMLQVSGMFYPKQIPTTFEVY